jgi:hypothetical protein
VNTNLDVNLSAAIEFIYLALITSCLQGSLEPSTNGLDVDSDVPIKFVKKQSRENLEPKHTPHHSSGWSCYELQMIYLHTIQSEYRLDT